MTHILHLTATFAALTLTLFLAVAAFGPRCVRIPLMMASLEDWGLVPLFGLVVLAVVAL